MFNSNYIITITVLLVITISIYTGRIRQQTNKNPKRKKSKELHHDEKSQHCFDPLSAPNLGLGRKGKNGHNVFDRIINVGFPKTGSKSLDRFLNQVDNGTSSHFKCHHSTACISEECHLFCGKCIQRAIHEQKPPLMSCGNTTAFAQMDYVGLPGNNKHKKIRERSFQKNGYHTDCIFPQIQYLEELYEENPTALFILPLRNVSNWIKSVSNWRDLRERLTNCSVTEYNFTFGMGKKDHELKDLFCNHVKHVRNFVQKHSSLSFVEFNIEDPNAGEILASVISGLNASSWGHFHKQKGKNKKK